MYLTQQPCFYLLVIIYYPLRHIIVVYRNEGVGVKMTVWEYFPGANTPKGFYSYYDYILKSREAERIIILKGGPGTGKSTFMKKIAQHLSLLGHDTELLHCSSDPNSLDGVCAREIGFLILDGTAPHVVDPKCPGAVDEIINLGECWDKEKICRHKAEIIEIGEQISSYFASAYRYMSAAKTLQMQMMEHSLSKSDVNRIRDELEKLKKELAIDETGAKQGEERKAFLSAVTPLGRINYIDTFARNADRVYKIKAENQKIAKVFMRELADMFIDSGKDIRTFYCPMSPNDKIEHIYTNGVFFTIENDFHKTQIIDTAHSICLDNYSDSREISSDSGFDKEQYTLLLDRAEKMIRTAKGLHDKLEEYYVPYMDFEKVQHLCTEVINHL